MNTEDDDLTNGPADDTSQAEGEQSEGKTKAKAEDDSKTETDDEGAEGEQPEGAGEEDDEKPKRRRSGVDRLKRERDALRAENDALRSRAPAADDSASIETAVLRDIGAPPKEADYGGDWFAYERALTAYETEKRIATREVRKQAEMARESNQRVNRELVEDYRERQRDARSSIPDFDTVMKSGASLSVAPVVSQLILESEKSALVEYHLAKNPKVLDRLNAMSPLQAAREFGAIESRLSLAKPNISTKAPPPVSAPKGGAGPSSQEARMEAYLKRQYGERA